MGFFANIPKPPKLAGFFGDEEVENASDGTNTTEGREKEGKNMEEIGGVMEDLELENAHAHKTTEEVNIPSTSSEQKLLTPMDLLNASRSDGGGIVTTNSGQQQMAPPPMLPPMPGAQHPMFGGQMPPRGPTPPGMPAQGRATGRLRRWHARWPACRVRAASGARRQSGGRDTYFTNSLIN